MQKQNEKQLVVILLGFAFLLGGFMRLYPAIQTGFPPNDGGLFYQMIRDLQQAGFRLPIFTSYNQLNIPFAYPPFPLYFVALLAQLDKLSLLGLVAWLPALISLLSIGMFFLLARKILGNDLQAALACMLYALLPHSFEWQIMGGGVTRAFGGFFYLLFAYTLYRVFWEKRGTPLSILAGSLLVLSHPEWALHGLVTAAYFWWTKGRNKAGVTSAALVAGGVALFTSPWWLSVLARYGMQLFFLAPKASGTHLLFWVPLLLLNFTGETVPFTALLGMIGVLYLLHSKRYFLPVWLLLVFLTDPRSSFHVSPIQISLLAAVALSEIIPAGLTLQPDSQAAAPTGEVHKKTGISFGLLMLAYCFILGIVNAQISVLKLAQDDTLPKSEQAALAWVSENTPPNSRFLVMGWQEDPTVSPILEWFPALTGRVSVSTVQGREWLPGSQNFAVRFPQFTTLQACLYQDLPCVDAWLANLHEDPVDYILFQLAVQTDAGTQTRASPLLLSVGQSTDYRLVYNTVQVRVYQHLHRDSCQHDPWCLDRITGLILACPVNSQACLFQGNWSETHGKDLQPQQVRYQPLKRQSR